MFKLFTNRRSLLHVVSVVSSSEKEIKSDPPASSTPILGSPLHSASASASSSPESPILSQAPSTTSYSQMGTISTADIFTPASPPSSPQSSSHPSRLVVNPVPQWAIWSRPQDPSHAPSIISPRARPPPDVVQQAMDIKTPPQSQPSSPTQPATILPAVAESLVEETGVGTTKEEGDAATPQPSEDKY